jgi:hypothetical protein
MLAELVPAPTCGTVPCSTGAHWDHLPSHLDHTDDTRADQHVPPWLTLDLRIPSMGTEE